MSNPTNKELSRFMGILSYFELTKEEIFAICHMLETTEAMEEVATRLKTNMTTREVKNICGEVIMKVKNIPSDTEQRESERPNRL